MHIPYYRPKVFSMQGIFYLHLAVQLITHGSKFSACLQMLRITSSTLLCLSVQTHLFKLIISICRLAHIYGCLWFTSVISSGWAKAVFRNISLKQHICLQRILESEPNTQDLGRIVQKSVPPVHVAHVSEICSRGSALSGVLLKPDPSFSHFLGKVRSQSN